MRETGAVEHDTKFYPPIFRPPVYYPETDGKPMAETDTHIKQLIYLREALSDYFRHIPDVYVAGNLMVYYREGDPSKSIAPDVFVVKGVPKRKRRIYKVWEEGKGPDVVFEITSETTRIDDIGPKKGIYNMLGVKEFFLFDPFGEYLSPRLIGFWAAGWVYNPMEVAEGEPLVSKELGLELHVEGQFLRLVDPTTGEKLPTPAEVWKAWREERATRRRLEAELEQLRAELARLRGEK